LVINDDVIVGPDYIANLLSICSKNPASIIGSVVVDHDTPDLIRLGGTKINWITAKFINVNKGRSLSEFPEGYCEYASYLTGRGTLFPVEVFRSIGLYDDKHFQQCGDTELPVRASRKGYKLLVSYSAVVYNQAESMEKFDARKTYKLRDLKSYFFDIKSNSRLRYAYHFAKNTSRNPLQFLVFLFFDIARKNYHFFSRIRL
jgi:GT2 family glycosyltransferase